MPYLTISGLFIEFWTMWTPQEAKENERALVKPCPSVMNNVWFECLDPEISQYSVVPEEQMSSHNCMSENVWKK